MGVVRLRGIAIITLIPAAAVVLVGAVSQRTTGLGFALIAAPLLTLMAGPYQGIVLANLLALFVAASVLAVSWRTIDRRRAAVLVPFGLLGVLPGVWVARALPPGPLHVVIGLLTLLGLGVALWRTRATSSAAPATGQAPTDRSAPVGNPAPSAAAVSPRAAGVHRRAEAASSGSRRPALLTAVAGTASGFMAATAGTGGPALTAYALATRWRQVDFAATAQVSFVGQAALAVGFKGVGELPGPMTLVVLCTAACAGLAAGHLVADRLPAEGTRRALLLIAVAGALATTAKGVFM